MWKIARGKGSNLFLDSQGHGEDVKVVQELLRLSTVKDDAAHTPKLSGQTSGPRRAKVVGMIRPKERVVSVYRDIGGVSVQSAEKVGVSDGISTCATAVNGWKSNHAPALAADGSFPRPRKSPQP